MLKGLVTINLLASAAHFFHNALFLETYPGPQWIPGPWFIVVAWLVIAAALVLGYLWHLAGKSRKALVAMSLYGLSCISVFGHYLYGHPRDFDLLTNFLIVSEGVAGTMLLIYFVGWARRGHEARA